MSRDMNVREFKRELHGWLPCGDESQRNMSSVEVIVGDNRLLNNEGLLSEAIPAEVTAFLSLKPVTCCSFSTNLRGEHSNFRDRDTEMCLPRLQLIGTCAHPELRDRDRRLGLPRLQLIGTRVHPSFSDRDRILRLSNLRLVGKRFRD